MKDIDLDEIMSNFEFSKYSCADPLMEDVRKLNYTDKAKVCKVFPDSLLWIMCCINDMDNSISCIDYNDPMTFFEVAPKLQKFIEKCGKKNK